MANPPENFSFSIGGLLQILRMVPSKHRLTVLFFAGFLLIGAFLGGKSLSGSSGVPVSGTSMSSTDTKKDNNITPPGKNDPDAALNAAVPINVGLNSKELKDNEASVFSDCDPKLQPGDQVWVMNEDGLYYPTILVRVVRVVERGSNNSHGCMFLSRDATKYLRLPFERDPGIKRLKMRWQKSIPQDDTAKTSDRPFFPPALVNINMK